MKKYILIILLLPIILAAGYLGYRYQKNIVSVVPYPYQLPTIAQAPEPSAPILITGDQLGQRLFKLKDSLPNKI